MGKLLDIARKSAEGAPMEILRTVDVTAESGIHGDYRGRSRRRQVTVLSRESWEAACTELGVELPWISRRANLFVEGISLADSIGKAIQIGSLTLHVTGETAPCNLMDEAYYGLRQKLEPEWRGGVTCKVITGGTIEVGDDVRLED
jgi:MOSC domain-containing protein YiiM